MTRFSANTQNQRRKRRLPKGKKRSRSDGDRLSRQTHKNMNENYFDGIKALEEKGCWSDSLSLDKRLIEYHHCPNCDRDFVYKGLSSPTAYRAFGVCEPCEFAKLFWVDSVTPVPITKKEILSEILRQSMNALAILAGLLKRLCGFSVKTAEPVGKTKLTAQPERQ